jgi:fucose 4-O-acetylase-like acetyltransferase
LLLKTYKTNWAFTLWHLGIAVFVFFTVWIVSTIAITMIDHDPKLGLAIGAAMGIAVTQAVLKRLNR